MLFRKTKKKPLEKPRGCYPCIGGAEWAEYIHAHEQKPLCRLKSDLFYYKEKLARIEADTRGKLISLFFAFVALIISFASLNLEAVGILDFLKMTVGVIICILFFGYYGCKLASFEIEHRKIHLHVVAIEFLIEQKTKRLKRAHKDKGRIKLIPIGTINNEQCALNPVPAKGKSSDCKR